jgi:lipoprotein signal peptidase
MRELDSITNLFDKLIEGNFVVDFGRFVVNWPKNI